MRPAAWIERVVRGTSRLRGLAGMSDTELGGEASLASMRHRGGICRQPSSFRPGNCCCGGVRVKGLNTGVVASTRRARWSRIFLVTLGSSMLAYTLTAPPQCSQVKMSIWNTRFKRCA